MNLLEVGSYTAALLSGLEVVETMRPWDAAEVTSSLLSDAMGKLPDAFERRNDIAVHRSAQIHPSVVISGPAIVDAGAVIGPHAVLRDGVFIGSDARIGASVEIKSSWVFERAALAHLIYVGNSIVGHDANLEAGAVIANHYNERPSKDVFVLIEGETVRTGRTKFGAGIGPRSRIGANAVTSPGTLLPADAVVGRLELVDQTPSRGKS